MLLYSFDILSSAHHHPQINPLYLLCTFSQYWRSMCTHVQSWGVEEATKGCTMCRGIRHQSLGVRDHIIRTHKSSYTSVARRPSGWWKCSSITNTLLVGPGLAAADRILLLSLSRHRLTNVGSLEHTHKTRHIS